MDIQGKVFIVTGGASGLGEGTARMLAANGGKVVIAERHAAAGEARKQRIEEDIWALVADEAKLSGWRVSADEARRILALDVELNAQGLDVWLANR